MGNQLLAIFPHDFSSAEDVSRIPEIAAPLTPEANAFRRVVGRHAGYTGVDVLEWQWSWYQEQASPQEDWAKYGVALLDGPADVNVGRGCLSLQPKAKWYAARREQQILAAAQSLFDLAARTLGASWYLCTHEGEASGYVLDGLTAEVIERKLQARGYARVPTVAQLFVPSPDESAYTNDVYCRVRV